MPFDDGRIPHPIVGVGSFLTRDRGWNWEVNGALLAGAERTTGSVVVRLAATFRAVTAWAATTPPSIRRCRRAWRTASRSRRTCAPPTLLGLYLVGGPEWFRVWREDRVRGSRVALAGGLGLGGSR